VTPRSTRAVVFVLVTILLSSCRSKKTQLSSSFSVADPSVSKQLIAGFYAIETGFRWAGPSFTVALAPPTLDPERRQPLKLTLSLYFPQNEIDQLGPVTITALGSEYQFGKVTYDKAGPHDFEVEIPPAAFLCTNVLPVTFTLDKHMRPTNGDARDLGVAVNRVSLRN
jgi:hypothetical protein